MKVFISGASGLVGSNCLRYFKQSGWLVVGTHLTFPTPETVYFNTLNPSDPNNYDVIAFRPDVIIHCGALTHVDYCESHEDESFEKNVVATENLLHTAQVCGAKFVFLSSDYVFDGKDGPYREEATPHPLNTYGKHKLAAEQLIRQSGHQHLILRVTNVYGDEIRKKNFIARILQQIETGAAVRLTLPYDQYASPVNALDIARAAAVLLAADKTGLYHIGGTDYLNRISLTLKVLSYFPEKEYDLTPKATKDLKQAAARPLYAGLIPGKFLSEFPHFLFHSVDEYLRAHLQA